MDKRDQINIILDPETREALDGLRSSIQPLPTITALVSYLLRKEWEQARRKGRRAGTV